MWKFPLFMVHLSRYIQVYKRHDTILQAKVKISKFKVNLSNNFKVEVRISNISSHATTQSDGESLLNFTASSIHGYHKEQKNAIE